VAGKREACSRGLQTPVRTGGGCKEETRRRRGKPEQNIHIAVIYLLVYNSHCACETWDLSRVCVCCDPCLFTAEHQGGMGVATEEGGTGEGAQAAGEEEQRGETVTWRIKSDIYILLSTSLDFL